jgi:uncharacterized protein
MKIHTFRLKPGQDLKIEIERFVAEKNIRAGFIITCVGGANKAILRSADVTSGRPSKQNTLTFMGAYENNFEITSLVGTVSTDGVHLHMSISDKEGKSFGGHLKEGTIIHPTAEIVIGEDESATYTRELDVATGFSELVVRGS